MTDKELKVRHKKRLILIAGLALLLAATLLLLAGCGSSGTALKGSSGGLTEASIGAPVYPGATKVDASQLQSGNGSGYRFRPQGSTPQGSTPQGSTPQGSVPRWRGQGSVPNGALQRNVTALWTKDSTDKVVAWYKKQLSSKPGFNQVNMPNFSGQTSDTTTYSFTSGDSTVMVMIRPAQQQKGGATIMITKRTGQAPFGRGFNGNPGQNPGQSPSQSPSQTF